MSTGIYLDFEKPVIELEKRIDQMREFVTDENLELTKEIRLLEHKLGCCLHVRRRLKAEDAQNQ